PRRHQPLGRRLRGPNSPRGEPRRAPRRTAHQVRTGDQPQDRQGPRPDDPAVAAVAGERGDPVTSDSAEAQEWHRIIRASVRACRETWRLQASGGPPRRGISTANPAPTVAVAPRYCGQLIAFRIAARRIADSKICARASATWLAV